MLQRKFAQLSLHQRGGVGSFFLGIIFCLIALFFIVVWSSGDSSSPQSASARDPISELFFARASGLKPQGVLAETFKIGGNHTDLQRQMKLKEIVGQVVDWTLPVYEVRQSGSGYLIQTSGQEFVSTFLHVTARDERDKVTIAGLKTGDFVRVKGVIEGSTLRVMLM